MLVGMLGGALGACQFPDYAVTAPAAPPSVELDPCATNPCLNGGRCIPFQGSFVCWATKPQDVPVGDCGCNAAGWSGHGAFYGGHPDANFCTPSGGGWAGVVDEGQAKGNITKWATKIWIR